MPPQFTRSLAARLDELGPLPVKEAADGDPLLPGRVLLAPGDRHLVIGGNASVRLSGDPPECGVRPSVNVTLASAASRYGAGTLAVVLTGMGSDGTRGAGEVKRAGGTVIAEAESTCVVYGMPRSVAEAGYADEILPLSAIAPAIGRLCAPPQRRASHG
jgi:two-component system chemotaxis response regulator CheB